MKYIKQDDVQRSGVNLNVGNISVSGSVKGMQKLYGWKKDGQVRVGGYIYNIGPDKVKELKFYIKG